MTPRHGENQDDAAATAAPAPVGRDEFDPTAALAGLGDDASLLAEVIGLFLADYPRLLAEMEVAVAATNLETLGRLAHTVQGVASNFAIPVVMRTAKELEKLTKGDDRAELAPALNRLKGAVARVHPLLEAAAAVVDNPAIL